MIDLKIMPMPVFRDYENDETFLMLILKFETKHCLLLALGKFDINNHEQDTDFIRFLLVLVKYNHV